MAKIRRWSGIYDVHEINNNSQLKVMHLLDFATKLEYRKVVTNRSMAAFEWVYFTCLGVMLAETTHPAE